MGEKLNLLEAMVLLKAEQSGRQLDSQIAEALGWRVSRDPWWNWHEGPVFDPPGDEWCIRKDGRRDLPCDEALPHFTYEMLGALVFEASPSPTQSTSKEARE